MPLVRLGLLLLCNVVAISAITVQTNKGPFTGYRDPQGAYSLKGIPFAAPPVGKLRFMPPVDAAPWTSPLNATVFGPGCFSKCRSKFAGLMCATTVSEDSLYLNVFTTHIPLGLRLGLHLRGRKWDENSRAVRPRSGRPAKRHSCVLLDDHDRLHVLLPNSVQRRAAVEAKQ